MESARHSRVARPANDTQGPHKKGGCLSESRQLKWPTSTPTNYAARERHAIQHENDPLPGPVQRDWFLSKLFRTGDGWTELRAILRNEPDRRKQTKRIFVPAGDLDGVEKFVQRHRDHDFYFAVAARRTQENGRLSNFGLLRAFFCDVDFKVTPEIEARDRLAQFVHPEPTLEVRSGNGLHLYWVLGQPMDLRTGADDCRRKLIGIAGALGGDLGSAEPAHVLRLPGTLNFKYNPPREVILEGF